MAATIWQIKRSVTELITTATSHNLKYLESRNESNQTKQKYRVIWCRENCVHHMLHGVLGDDEC